MTPRDIAWKWTAYGAALALITIFNYYVLTFLPLGAVPMLLPVTAVAVGVLEGARAGAGFGIAAGIVLAAATHGSLLWRRACPCWGGSAACWPSTSCAGIWWASCWPVL